MDILVHRHMHALTQAPVKWCFFGFATRKKNWLPFPVLPFYMYLIGFNICKNGDLF